MNLPPLSKLLHIGGIDKAVVFSISTRLTVVGGHLLTLALLTVFLTVEMQGFFFTFLSLVALQSFFELGFYLVIVNVVSHEWAELHIGPDGKIAGPAKAASRLASLLRLTLRWYGVIYVLFVLVVGTAGYFVISREADEALVWKGPWIALVVASGLQIWLSALLYFLEGCGQVASAQRMRLISTVIGQVALWSALAAGWKLWASPLLASISSVILLCLLISRYRVFFWSLLRQAQTAIISWRHEMWPLQWRLAAQGVVNFFFFSLFTPITFYYHGADDAGRIGMTWSIASGLMSLAAAWIQSQAPQFGALIAQSRYAEVDQHFRKTVKASSAVLLLLLIGTGAAMTLLQLTHLPIADRYMGPLATACFFAAVFLLHILTCLSVYTRAHKVDPTTGVVIVTGLVVGALVWATARFLTPTAEAIAFLCAVVLLTPWYIWVFCRFRSARRSQAEVRDPDVPPFPVTLKPPDLSTS